ARAGLRSKNMEVTRRSRTKSLARLTPLPVRMSRHRQMVGRDRISKYWVTLAYGGWVATALHSDSRGGWRDGDEGVVYFFRSWSRCRCSLRAHQGKKSGAAHRRITRPLGDGAWGTV